MFQKHAEHIKYTCKDKDKNAHRGNNILGKVDAKCKLVCFN